MPSIRIAAAAIQNTKGELLLVRKAGTEAFMRPGGKIEVGESAEQALVRELAEELSVEVEVQDLRFLGSFTAPAAHEVGQTVEADVFCLSIDGPFRNAAEIDAVIWYGGGDKVPLAPLTEYHVLPRCGVR